MWQPVLPPKLGREFHHTLAQGRVLGSPTMPKKSIFAPLLNHNCWKQRRVGLISLGVTVRERNRERRQMRDWPRGWDLSPGTQFWRVEMNTRLDRSPAPCLLAMWFSKTHNPSEPLSFYLYKVMVLVTLTSERGMSERIYLRIHCLCGRKALKKTVFTDEHWQTVVNTHRTGVLLSEIL